MKEKRTPLFGGGDTPSFLVTWSHQQQCPDHFHVWFDVELLGKRYEDGSDVMIDERGANAYISNELSAVLLEDHRVEHAISLMAINRATTIFQEANP
jgi:hypothetical protein